MRYLLAIPFAILCAVQAQVMLPHRHATGVAASTNSLWIDFGDYWRLDEASGTRQSIRGLNPLVPVMLDTPTSVSGVSTLTTNGVRFDLPNLMYLRAEDSPTISLNTNQFSFTTWVKILSYSADTSIVFGKVNTNTTSTTPGRTNAEYYLEIVYGVNKEFMFGVSPGNETDLSAVVYGDTPNITNIWQFVACRYTNGNITIDVRNDVASFSATNTFTSPIWNSPWPLTVGGGSTNGQAGIIVDEIGMWNRKLTAAEIELLYNFGRGNPYPFDSYGFNLTSLAGYWRLDEASGTRYDVLGTNNMTSVNAVGSAAGVITNCATFATASSRALTNAPTTALASGSTIAITAFVNLASKTQANVVAARYDGGASQRGYMVYYDNTIDRFKFIVSTNGTSTFTATANSFGSPTQGTWYWVYAYYDSAAQTIGISVNNGAIDTTAVANVIFATTAGFTIGANLSSGAIANPLDGSIDEVSIWRRTLNYSERAFIYNGGTGRTYPFTP